MPITDKIFCLNFNFETSGLKRTIMLKFTLTMKLNNFELMDVLFNSDGIDFNEDTFLFMNCKFSSHESQELKP